MKRWSSVAGSVFAALIMGVVLYHYGGDLRAVELANTALLPRFAGSLALYVVVILIGAFGWRVLQKAFGGSPAPWVAERQLLISQIGKYVPGNIAQYVGRAAMTINSGVPAKTVGIAIVTETAVILIGGLVAVAISFALAPDLAGSLRQVLPDTSRAIWIGAAVAVFLVLLFGMSIASSLSKRFRGFPKVNIGGVLVATFLSTISFLILGVSLHLIVGALASTPVPMSISVAVFAAAWIAGLATPGAPGGLGVRESVLTLGLAPVLGGAAALSAALVYRGVSVLGDAISFGFGLLLPKNDLGTFGATPT